MQRLKAQKLLILKSYKALKLCKSSPFLPKRYLGILKNNFYKYGNILFIELEIDCKKVNNHLAKMTDFLIQFASFFLNVMEKNNWKDFFDSIKIT